MKNFVKARLELQTWLNYGSVTSQQKIPHAEAMQLEFNLTFAPQVGDASERMIQTTNEPF